MCSRTNTSFNELLTVHVHVHVASGMHLNDLTTQGHVMTKGDETSKAIIPDIETILYNHHDRNVREAALDALVQVFCLHVVA